MKPLVIGFSGRIKSGKTTISQAVANALNVPRASFGDYVRAEAKRRGLDASSRLILQHLGETLISQGWSRFCRDVLATIDWQPGTPVVVDGIRHVEAAREISRIVAPLRFVLVHVDIDEQVRTDRFCELDQHRDAESHSTEVDVQAALPAMADLIIDGAQPVDDLVQTVLTKLGER